MTDLTPPVITGRIGKMRVVNHRYNDGQQSYQRVSNLLKNIETETFALDEWKANTLAVGLASRPDLVLGVAAAAQYDPATGKLTGEAKSTLKGLRYQAMEAGKSKAGANAGTAVHTATERVDMGESVEQVGLPAPYDADLRAYVALKAKLGLTFRPELIERTVRVSALGAAGTIDRAGECALLVERGILEPDESIIVDVKTEERPLLNLIHIAPQLGTYANADDMFVPEPTAEAPNAGRYEPMPNVSKLVGLVIHVRNGRAVPYLVNLVEGWDSAQRAFEQREAMKRSKIGLGEPGCWAVPLLPADPAEAAAERGGQRCLTCQKPLTPGRTHDCGTGAVALPAASGEVQQAVRRPDGNVEWQPAGIPPGPQPLEAMLWEAVMAAESLDELGRLFEQATATGVEWAGPIADAGLARSRVVQCAQRAMHDPTTTAKCACGWARGMAP